MMIKRYCHMQGRSKCYENVHKLDVLREEVREIKELIKKIEEPTVIIYSCSILSLLGTMGIILSK